jgi:uncharacterized protein YgiM (DUF1202 family)
MRMTSNLIIGMMLSSSLLAQQPVNPSPPPAEPPATSQATTNAVSPAPAEAGVTNTPAATKKTPTKKKSGKSSAKPKQTISELKTVPLVPGPAVVDANHVNVRGQPKLNSEVVTRLSKDQKVTVITEITRNNSGPDEPSAWAKIALPSDVHVWINGGFIDPSNKTVKSKKLNVRGGPGENFSVLGLLERGEAVSQVSVKGDWIEIEAPTNSYAFVAAQYLKQDAAASVTALAEPPSVSAILTNEPPIATAPTSEPSNAATSAPSAAAPTGPIANADTPAADTNAPAAEEPPVRIVEREGIVRGTTSIQAPTHFKLVSSENGQTIDYLYTSSPNLDLRRYKGLRIIVTGEEGLEERWGNTPVITIQKIQVVE